MKIMNRKEGKKIAMMAAIIIGFMVVAFMPAASAGVTSFTVTPSSGVVGAVDSYNALVTTDGVTSINITIPAGFIAVPPATGGVEIARVDFWNSSTKAYYGYATITANDTYPTTQVDIHCDFGGLTASKPLPVNYNPGATNTFVSGFGSDTSSAIIKLPTEAVDGSINITITCTAFHLDDVMIAIGQFVRNPTVADDYDFIADGVTETVNIIALRGCAAVFRGSWWADTNGDHKTDIYFKYGLATDTPLVGDVNYDGSNDVVVFRNMPSGGGRWWVCKQDRSGTDYNFGYGVGTDKPVIGDVNNGGDVNGDGSDDVVAFRNGWWYVAKAVRNTGTDYKFKWGTAGDIPLIADIDNDGIDELVIFRGAGNWYVAKGDHSGTDYSFQFGATGDKPIIDDINNDGYNDVAVLRNGRWWVSKPDHTGTDYSFKYGIPGDDPVVHEIG